MMTEHDTAADEPIEDDIASAARKLQESFDEMSDLTHELSGSMSEVADGFESLGEVTRSLPEPSAARIDTAGPAAADD